MKMQRLRSKSLFPLLVWALALLPAEAGAVVTPTGTVAGTVRPVEWAQEIEVCMVEPQPSETCTVPGADGSYLLQEVPLGGVRVEFLPSIRSRLLKQYYDHKSSLDSAATIVLTSKKPDATGIDADLVEGGAMHGTVTAGGTGQPLAEVEVCGTSVAAPTVKRCSETDPSGSYELHSLPGGKYRVAFRGRGTSADYELQYYDGKQALAEATPVAVLPGESVPGIDAALSKGARIEGSVTDGAGTELPGITVCLFAESSPTAWECTYSDAAGTYAFQGLGSGSYQIGFSLTGDEITGEGGAGATDGFASQYFDGVGDRAQAATISVLAPATVAGVDAALSPLPQPLPAPASPAVASPIVAAAPVVPEPKPKPKRCRKGFRKQKVKGKVRCVKAAHRHRRHKHARHHNRKGQG